MNSTVQFWWFCILSFKFGGDRSPGPLALEGMAHLIPSNTSRPTRLTRCHAIIPLETPARLNYLCAHGKNTVYGIGITDASECILIYQKY